MGACFACFLLEVVIQRAVGRNSTNVKCQARELDPAGTLQLSCKHSP